MEDMGFDTSTLGAEGEESFIPQPASANTTANAATADESTIDGGDVAWAPTANLPIESDEPKDEKKQTKELKEEDYDLLAALVRQLYDADTAFYIEETKNAENLDQLRADHAKKIQILHEPILLTLGNSEQRAEHLLTRDLFDLSPSAKVFFEITRALQDSPVEEKTTARQELELLVSQGLTREVVRKVQESQRAAEKEEETEEAIKNKAATEALDEIIQSPDLTEEKKKRFTELRKRLLTLPGEITDQLIQKTHLDEFIEFLIVGSSYGSSAGSYENMRKNGEEWLVGESQIIEVFGEGAAGAQRCFSAMEEAVLEFGDSDVQKQIKGKEQNNIFFDGDKKFDFAKYKEWLIAKYKLCFALQRDRMIKKLKEQLCDKKGGRKGIKALVDGEQREIDEHKSEELRLSQEALDVFLTLAMAATDKSHEN